jgi:hypothetical protein
LDGLEYVLLLRALVSAGEQDHYGLSIEAEINSVAGAKVELQLIDSFVDVAIDAKLAIFLDALKADADSGSRLSVAESLNPLSEWFSAIRRFVVPDDMGFAFFHGW